MYNNQLYMYTNEYIEIKVIVNTKSYNFRAIQRFKCGEGISEIETNILYVNIIIDYCTATWEVSDLFFLFQ